VSLHVGMFASFSLLSAVDSAPEKQAQPIRAECERLRVRLDEINSKIVMLSDSLCVSLAFHSCGVGLHNM